ncbi:hypothetical protein [Paracoccus ravus]|uniref:hypothetical protein n=1 Tax=Paracoccus ravus TaxID=2447760 RepID=UPI00106DE0ED|nr:hypothetical protein [Paracoccus ravus]
MMIVAILCFIASYFIQERILHFISDNATAGQKRSAALLVFSADAIHSEAATLRGMDFDQVDRTSPSFKTFMALFPAMALYTDNVEGKTEREVRQLVRNRAEREMGGLKHMTEDVYADSEAAIKESYKSYAEGSNAYLAALDKIPGEQQRANAKYKKKLGRRRPDQIPRHMHAKVARDVQNAGVPVPNNWKPTDKAGFDKAVASKITDQARAEFDVRMRRDAGFAMTPALEFKDYVAHDMIQSRWREKLGMTHKIPLRTDLSETQFRDQIYLPWLNAIEEDETAKLLAPVPDFEPGGKHEKDGNLAIRIAFVPLVAFTFSIAGALFHIVKTSWLATKVLRAEKRSQLLVCALALVVTLGYFGPITLRADEITQSELYMKLEADVSSKAGTVLATGMRLLIQFQRGFYPIAEGLRSGPLQGLSFGVNESNS